MNANPEVIDCLNALLAGELAARDQYFIHSRMYQEWHYPRLYERMNHEMEEETQHASALIERILLLGGTPMMKLDALNIGKNPEEMLGNDLQVELSVREHLKKGIALCEKHADFVSRTILVDQLQDTEEDHAHWLEQQLRLIKETGLQNWLQSQSQA